MLTPDVCDGVDFERAADAGQRRDAVLARETLAVACKVRSEGLATQCKQVVLHERTVQLAVFRQHQLTGACRWCALQGFTHGVHGTGQHVVIRVHEGHEWMRAQPETNLTASGDVSLHTWHDVDSARLTRERFQTLIEPVGPSAGMREDVHIDHGQNVGRLTLYSSAVWIAPETRFTELRLPSAPDVEILP